MARASEILFDERDFTLAKEFFASNAKIILGVDLMFNTATPKVVVNPKSNATYNVVLSPARTNNSMLVMVDESDCVLYGDPNAQWLVILEGDSSQAHLIGLKQFKDLVTYCRNNGGGYQGVRLDSQGKWTSVWINHGWGSTNKFIAKSVQLPEKFHEFRGLKLASNESFCHLHAHSGYSLLDGVAPPEDLVMAAAMNGQPGLALTDHGYMYGIYKFWEACQEAGIRSVLGTEAYLVDDVSKRYKDATGNDRRFEYHQTLLAMNQTGYENLCELMSVAGRDHYYYVPRIDHKMLFKYSEGIICLSGCFKGPVAFHLQQHLPEITKDLPYYQYNKDKSYTIAKQYREVFGDRYYIEVHKNDFERYMNAVPEICQLADDLSIHKVVAQDSHYAKTEDAEIQRLVTRISNQKVDELGEAAQKFGPYFIRQISEMTHPCFSEDMFTRSADIMERCTATLETKGYLFPRYPVEQDSDWNAFTAKQKGDSTLTVSIPNIIDEEEPEFRIPARTTDPDTSYEAGAPFAKWTAEHDFVIACISQLPGSTARELDKAFAPDQDGRIRKRLAECETAGCVRRGEKRTCKVTGRRAITWNLDKK